MKTIRLTIIATALLACTHAGSGLTMEQIGPYKDTVAPHRWPAGLVKILAHDSRVYYLGGNGNENFYFKSLPEQIGELIKLYSQTRLRDHVLTIKSGKPETKTMAGDKIGYNVHFHHLEGFALTMSRWKGLGDTLEPTLTIHVDAADDLALLNEIKVPEHFIVKNEVRGWPVKGKAAKPERKAWHAEIVFDNKLPAVDFEGGLQTTVTLWEKNRSRGFPLGTVGTRGQFNVPLSGNELEDLKTGRMWLTMTVGNWTTKPKKEDPRLEIAEMSIDPKKVKSVEVQKPRYHYGRVLFDDGSPAILDPVPWPGAQIAVNFPYAGMVNLDKEGYFNLFFTTEQFEAMKARKIAKNVYIPDFEEKHSSRALYAFPVTDLSLEKEEAGELRIAKPRAKKKEK